MEVEENRENTSGMWSTGEAAGYLCLDHMSLAPRELYRWDPADACRYMVGRGEFPHLARTLHQAVMPGTPPLSRERASAMGCLLYELFSNTERHARHDVPGNHLARSQRGILVRPVPGGLLFKVHDMGPGVASRVLRREPASPEEAASTLARWLGMEGRKADSRGRGVGLPCAMAIACDLGAEVAVETDGWRYEVGLGGPGTPFRAVPALTQVAGGLRQGTRFEVVVSGMALSPSM